MSYDYHIAGKYANDEHTPKTLREKFDRYSAEEMRELTDLVHEDEERTRAKAALPNEIEKFLALHPEFDNDENPASPNPNGALINVELKLRGLDPATATAHDFRDSYHRLKAAGIPLRLKEAVVKKQREEKIRKEADDIKKHEQVSEDDLYAMPMDKLRQRAGGGF